MSEPSPKEFSHFCVFVLNVIFKGKTDALSLQLTNN